jgi:L-aminopeptidase/D-esterase-like protein
MTIRPGPKNLITDVTGITVGQAHDAGVRTGVTVVLPEGRAVAGGDVRGGGPGTRETDALDPANLVEAVDAVVLSGGSSYGLAAASGVVDWLGARGRGFTLGASPLVSPVVPAAILFDLTNGGDKDWGEQPPYDRLGREAVAAAGDTVALGKAGAGYGARAGGHEGGTGSASAVTADGITVGALVAANPFGSPYLPDGKTFRAWMLEQDGELGGQTPPTKGEAMGWPVDTKLGAAAAGANTSLAVVATDAALTPSECKRIAMMAQDGFALAVSPIHTLFDGDTVFVLATGRRSVTEPRALTVSHLGTLAAQCVARALMRGVYEARKAKA